MPLQMLIRSPAIHYTSKPVILTFALALRYALAQASAKSGTNSGLSTGGGCLGELAGYKPGMGGSEDGDGKGSNA
jgi:hypothetical protein